MAAWDTNAWAVGAWAVGAWAVDVDFEITVPTFPSSPFSTVQYGVVSDDVNYVEVKPSLNYMEVT